MIVINHLVLSDRCLNELDDVNESLQALERSF
jgi:hypothetical protein